MEPMASIETRKTSRVKPWIGLGLVASLVALAASARAGDAPLAFADQGPAWTPQLREAYYHQDQGSRLIPLAWLQALRQADGTPFLAGSLTRYGYLSTGPTAKPDALPIGFTVSAMDQGPTVGLTCAACHTRDLTVADTTYRIDGGPAFADFGTFVVDLDTAVLRVLENDMVFSSFAQAVLGDTSSDPSAALALRARVALWSLRFHALIGASVPKDKPWGPARVDAIGMIYNHLAGLDLGAAPTYLIADNMAIADAPTRYPFLWNAGLQDHTQWGGFAANGNDGLALARNLGQVFGVFAAFHPEPKSARTPLDRDYLAANSANIAGIAMAEGELTRLGPPVWPFPVDHALAEKGKAVFDRPMSQGGCVQCHGVREGDPRPPAAHTWRTTSWDAGTDLHQWQVLLREAKTGSLEGATVPGASTPLGANDLSFNILKAVVTGSLAQVQAAQAAASAPAASPPTPSPLAPSPLTPSARTAVAPPVAEPSPKISADDIDMTMHVAAMPPTPMPPGTAFPGTYVYEARVLHGIWAAAPFLHNGSVPSLADLLTTSSLRRKSFAIGPAYDIATVGLAIGQPPGTFVLHTTGCEDRNSGDSDCGHEYGTGLPVDDKTALLEYLKTL